jgi:hypothetical protein
MRIKRVTPAGEVGEPDPKRFEDRRDYLAALTQGFIASHLTETAVYHREYFIVLSGIETRRGPLHSWLVRFGARPEGTFMAIDRGISLKERAEHLIRRLQSMGIDGHLLTAEELRLLADELYGRKEAGATILFRNRPGEVELGHRHYATFVVDRYPGEEVQPGWLLPLSSFKGELHVGIHFLPLETDRMLAMLQHKIRDLTADQMSGMETGAADHATLTTLPDARVVHEALARNEEKAFAVSFFITVGASSPGELRAQVQALEASCRQMMLKAVQPYFEMHRGLLASWPLAINTLGCEQILTGRAASTLLPWLQEDLSEPQGHYWGYNNETGGLVVFDPFDEGRFPNANIAVLAQSGAGKSYAAASVLLSGYARGLGAIILDPEAEYGSMVRALGGTYLDFSSGSGHAINALDAISSENQEEGIDPINDVVELVALMCGSLDQVERAQLEAVIRRVVSAPGQIRVLGDVSAALARSHPGSRISTILSRWVSGDLGRLFSAPTNVDLNAEVIGFNLRDLKDEMIAPAYLLLANWLWTMLRRQRRRRHLLIDEAGLLLEHEPIRRFLVRLARRIRKYGGSLILVSQNPGDFFETKDGAVLAANPSILLLGMQQHSEALKLQRAYSLTDRQIGYLETARRGDFLLLAGPNRVPVHIMAAPWMDELIVASAPR